MQMTDLEREHGRKVRELLPECTVLLKKNGDFPLKEAGKIALYGNGARKTSRGGTGSGEVYSHFAISVEKGLELAGFTVTTKEWLDGYDEIWVKNRERFLKNNREEAKRLKVNPILLGMGAVMEEPEYELPLNGEGDVAVYVLSRISGEGRDRKFAMGDVMLTATECRDILELKEKYARFMLVLNVGGPVDLTPVKEVENILVLSQLGAFTGWALAKILLGKRYPSGKLTTTWAGCKDVPDIMEFSNYDDTRYMEGVYVGYRYYDAVKANPDYPFGFGLSYTEFELESLEVQQNGELVTVRCKVTNTGHYAGKEVVQVYVSVPAGRLDQPYQMLAGFAKTKELKPGESREVSVAFAMSELASFDTENACYLLEKGDYILRVGNGSRNTEICGVVRLEEDCVTRRVRHALSEPGFPEFRPKAAENVRLPEGIKILSVRPSDISTHEVSYQAQEEIDPRLHQFTDEELIYLNIGAFDETKGLRSVIGNAGKRVAGTAGETTGKLEEKGVPVLTMADGPAGLRLCKHYWADENGAHPMGDQLMEELADYLSKPMAALMKLKFNQRPKKGAEIRNQYCTAIPIGTAIAQSWNLKLARECGDIVGREMEEFGVDLWLAPALNIHRDIRCGRNFEYFSEDPLISGKFAAAITNGVQKHPGRGAVIKHFAANNQETNRYYNNSAISERTMREIYLKGFEIAVRESQPVAVMSSYNLLNGRHTSERKDLLDGILRREFGFEGIVMTDWIMGSENLGKKYGTPRAYRIAMAGSELVMPGSAGDFEDMKNALKSGRLTRKQLLINATGLMKVIHRLKDNF